MVSSMRSALAAVLARLGQQAQAWQALEEDLGRGLLDELDARQAQHLTPAERARVKSRVSMAGSSSARFSAGGT
jgi:hypothetical protein